MPDLSDTGRFVCPRCGQKWQAEDELAYHYCPPPGGTYEDEDGTLLLTYSDRREGFELQMIDPPDALLGVLLTREQAERLWGELGEWLERFA